MLGPSASRNARPVPRPYRCGCVTAEEPDSAPESSLMVRRISKSESGRIRTPEGRRSTRSPGISGAASTRVRTEANEREIRVGAHDELEGPIHRPDRELEDEVYSSTRFAARATDDCDRTERIADRLFIEAREAVLVLANDAPPRNARWRSWVVKQRPDSVEDPHGASVAYALRSSSPRAKLPITSHGAACLNSRSISRTPIGSPPGADVARDLEVLQRVDAQRPRLHLIDVVLHDQLLQRVDLAAAIGDAGEEQQVEREVRAPLAGERDRAPRRPPSRTSAACSTPRRGPSSPS